MELWISVIDEPCERRHTDYNMISNVLPLSNIKRIVSNIAIFLIFFFLQNEIWCYFHRLLVPPVSLLLILLMTRLFNNPYQQSNKPHEQAVMPICVDAIFMIDKLRSFNWWQRVLLHDYGGVSLPNYPAKTYYIR